MANPRRIEDGERTEQNSFVTRRIESAARRTPPGCGVGATRWAGPRCGGRVHERPRLDVCRPACLPQTRPGRLPASPAAAACQQSRDAPVNKLARSAGSTLRRGGAWASAHIYLSIRANRVTRPPWKNGLKIKKRKHAEKEQFSMFMLYIESNQGRQV